MRKILLEKHSPERILMDNPISSSQQALEKRNVALRIIVSLLWFLPVTILINMIVGGFIGGFSASNKPPMTFDQGYDVGKNASQQFFYTYGQIVFLAEAIIWFILCFKGVLPGTSKFKKAKT